MTSGLQAAATVSVAVAFGAALARSRWGIAAILAVALGFEALRYVEAWMPDPSPLGHDDQ